MDITKNEEPGTHEVFDLQTADELKDSPDAAFDRPYIPRGKIPSTLQSVEVGESKNGNSMITWTFAVVGGYGEGREIKTRTVLSQPYRVRKIVDAVGLQPEENGKYAFTDPKHQGLRCVLHIVNDKRNLEWAEIKAVLPPSVDSEIPF